MISQTLPMAAMFMRNKMMSWTSVFLALQAYLTDPVNKPAGSGDSGAQPPLLRLAFAFISLLTCYMEFFFPATGNSHKRTVTEKVADAVNSVVSEVSSAASSATA